MAQQLSQDTRDRGESQTNQEEHRATLSDEQLEQSSLVLPGGIGAGANEPGSKEPVG